MKIKVEETFEIIAAADDDGDIKVMLLDPAGDVIESTWISLAGLTFNAAEEFAKRINGDSLVK